MSGVSCYKTRNPRLTLIWVRREGMLHESYREVAGGKLTFYPPTEPPPVKVLDVSLADCVGQKSPPTNTAFCCMISDWHRNGFVSRLSLGNDRGSDSDLSPLSDGP